MIRREVSVGLQGGLVYDTATGFIQRTTGFRSRRWIGQGTREVNAKSLLGMLSLGIKKGDTVTIAADGPDEEEAITSLEEYLTNQ